MDVGGGMAPDAAAAKEEQGAAAAPSALAAASSAPASSSSAAEARAASLARKRAREARAGAAAVAAAGARLSPAELKRMAAKYLAEDLLVLVGVIRAWNLELDHTVLETVNRFRFALNYASYGVRMLMRARVKALKDASLPDIEQELKAMSEAIPVRVVDLVPTKSEQLLEQSLTNVFEDGLPFMTIRVNIVPSGMSTDYPPYVNAMACRLLGYSREEMSKLLLNIVGWRRLYDDESWTRTWASNVVTMRRGQGRQTDRVVMRTRDGRSLQGLQTCHISYSTIGFPVYITRFIQPLEGPEYDA